MLHQGRARKPLAQASGRKRRPLCVFPLAGCRFWWERQNPTPGACALVVMLAEHEYMRRYASHARHCVDPVSLFNRQVP
jgi:hypothetical protein